MPTAYTAPVATGEVTTAKDFILSCARNFVHHLRDEPPSSSLKYAVASTIYSDKKEQAANEIVRLTNLSPAEKHREAESDYSGRVERKEARRARNQMQSHAYERMAAKVNAWEAPSPDHVALKNFCLAQLASSKEWDCSGDDSAKIPDKAESGESYVWRRISELSKDIEFWTKQHEDEVRRVAQANAWIAALEDSL